jgi:MFS superfamily sulfate permease-like transporter
MAIAAWCCAFSVGVAGLFSVAPAANERGGLMVGMGCAVVALVSLWFAHRRQDGRAWLLAHPQEVSASLQLFHLYKVRLWMIKDGVKALVAMALVAIPST